MKSLLPVLIGFAALVIFIIALRKGAFLKFSAYVDETKEELRKCTWPTWAELWGSTQVVIFSILALGVFTVLVDLALAYVIRQIV